MKRSTRSARLLAAGLALAASFAGAVTSGADAAKPTPPSVPGDIAVEAGHKAFLVGHAVGVQIYRCTTPAPGQFAWGPSTPRANLYDDRGKLIMTHFGGPSWQTKDGSTVVAARVNGVTVDPTAIPWLLLRVTSATAGPDGDRLTKTTFIQRTATTGGLAPASSACNAGTVDTSVEVPYTADYHFWKATGR
jgi:hypothetical protein